MDIIDPSLNDIEEILKSLDDKNNDFREYYVSFNYLNPKKWQLPREPGEIIWSYADIDKDTPSHLKEFNLLYLYTLAGLLIGPSLLNSDLYLATFDGYSKELSSFYFEPHRESEATKLTKNIKKGIVVEKACLLLRLDKWNEYTAINFASDCLERTILFEDSTSKPPSIYQDSIELFRAWADYRYKEDESRISDFFGKSFYTDHASRCLDNFYSKVKEEKQQNPFSYFVTGEAIINCLPYLYDYSNIVLQATYFAKKSYILRGFSELYQRGINISWSLPKSEEEAKIRDKIWSILHKKELGWQVTRLRTMLGVDLIEGDSRHQVNIRI